MSAPAFSWPGDLYLSASIRPLAVALYVAHCRAEGKRGQAFDTLDTHVKRFYDELAVHTVRGLLVPKREYFPLAAELARAARDKVIGRISPSEPWGETQ